MKVVVVKETEPKVVAHVVKSRAVWKPVRAALGIAVVQTTARGQAPPLVVIDEWVLAGTVQPDGHTRSEALHGLVTLPKELRAHLITDDHYPREPSKHLATEVGVAGPLSVVGRHVIVQVRRQARL